MAEHYSDPAHENFNEDKRPDHNSRHSSRCSERQFLEMAVAGSTSLRQYCGTYVNCG
jgi:hypothetical protein